MIVLVGMQKGPNDILECETVLVGGCEQGMKKGEIALGDCGKARGSTLGMIVLVG